MPASSSDDAVALNRRYWEQLAPHRQGEPLSFFRDGGSPFTADEEDALGDVDGLRVLQLACAVGDEALAFAQRGAQVTAVDIAAGHLATGREKAVALGLSVDFIEQDMTDLDPGIGRFDLVHISWGGLCWVQDLAAWARQVASHLTPGGRILISEHHPLWEVLTVRGEGELSVSGDYFGEGRDGYVDPQKAPEVIRRLELRDLPSRSVVWGIGAVVTALLEAGLTLRALREQSVAEMYPGLGESASRMPATYLVVASRATSADPADAIATRVA